VDALGIGEADVLVAIFPMEGGRGKPFAPAVPAGGTPFNGAAGKRAPPGKNPAALPCPFTVSWPSGLVVAAAGFLALSKTRPEVKA
jgi:hypothetical protein